MMASSFAMWRRHNFPAVFYLFSLFAPLALGQSFSLPSTTLDISATPGMNHFPAAVPITAPSGYDYSLLSASSDSSWVTPSIDAVGGRVLYSFATSALVNRTYTATITVTDGTNSRQTFVRATVSLPNIIALKSDPTRVRVYGVQQDGVNQGSVVVYDPLRQVYLGNVSVGNRPTDLAVSSDGSELLVICATSQTVMAVDLGTFAIKQTITLPAFTEWDPAQTTGTAAHVAYGPGRIIYYTDDAWAPMLNVFDRGSGLVLQSVGIDSNSIYGVGRFAVTPDQTGLIGWAQYGWSAGITSSFISKYAIGTGGLLTFVAETSGTYPTVLDRDPLNTPVLISSDGSVAAVKQLLVSAATVTNTVQAMSSPIYAITPKAEVLATQSSLYSSVTGNKLYDLPVTATVQAITADYSRLVYFDTNNKTLATVDLTAALSTSSLGLTTSPQNQAVVLPPTQLQWSPVLGTTRYAAYLGTSSAAVAQATPSSSTYLGEVVGTSLTLSQPLTAGQTYFWRVDPETANETVTGQVMSFTVSLIASDTSSISAATVAAQNNYAVPVGLSSAAPGATWAASASAPWISFSAVSGVTPATLHVILDATQLPAGVNQGSVTITTSTGPFTIPVTLQVDPLMVTVIRSDPSSAMVYAVSENTGAVSPRAYLLEIDAQNKRINRVAQVGSSATDLAIHHGDGRVYVTNWMGGHVLGVSLASFTVDKTLAFAPFAGDGYGQGDAYRISAGGAGRLVVEPEDQWISIMLYDTGAGAILSQVGEREGGGSYAPDLRYYFHGEDNISDACITKYDTTADKFTSVATGANTLGSFDYYGSRIVVVTEDGGHVFWNGIVFTSQLATQWTIGDQILSATSDGHYAFGATKVYDVVGQQIVLGIPAAASVNAFNSATGQLVLQNGKTISYYPVNSTLALAAPVLAAVPGSITTRSVGLQWSSDTLNTGFILQMRLSGSGSWTDLTSTLSSTATAYTPTGLTAATSYDFRIQATGPVSSSPWSNVVSVSTAAGAPVFTVQPQSQSVASGSMVEFTAAASGAPTPAYQWYYDGMPISGATGSSYSIGSAQAANAGNYTVTAVNSLGGATSATATLTVNAPPAIALQPQSPTIIAGLPVSFTVGVSGSPSPGCQWQESTNGGGTWSNLSDGGAFGGTATATLVIGAVNPAMSGVQFRLTATNSSGSVTSAPVTLTVSALPTGGVVGYAFTTLAGVPPGSADGTGSGARFNNSRGVAVDSSGNVYVADTGNNTIRKITSSGAVTTLAGAPGRAGSADGMGNASRFNSPIADAVDVSGNVYVADYLNNTIRKITASGAVTTFAGAAGHTGSADGAASAASFDFPSSVAVDGSGNVYVADYGNSTIRKITSDGVVATLAGTAGSTGSADGTGSAARFDGPTGIAVDASGNVYVADYDNSTIRKITPGGAVTTLAGTAGSNGSADGTGSGARFSYPSDVTVDGLGNVYVADSANETIRKVTPGGQVTTLAGTAGLVGTADGTGSAARFNGPIGVAVDGSGNVYVADCDSRTIRKVAAGGLVTTLAGMASDGSTDGTGSAAKFYLPSGVAVDASGSVYVSDYENCTIRKIASGGVVTTLAGTAGGIGSSDGLGSAARFRGPDGIAVDGSGSVYVADCGNNTIRKITAGGLVSTLAGTAGNTGSANGTGGVAMFNTPYGIAVDGSGNVYVADTFNDTIRKISPGGVVSTLAGAVGMTGSTDGTGTAARFKWPTGVAVDGSGTLYIADYGNNAVRKMTSGGAVTTLAGTAGGTGWADGTGSAAQFNGPYGVAVDGSGNVYVTDSNSNTIRKITSAGVVTTLAGAAPISGPTDGMGSDARFSGPFGIAVDGTGGIYVADYYNNAIREGVPALETAPSITLEPQSQTVNAGTSVTFTVAATGSPAPAYQWQIGGASISGATNAALTLTNVQSTVAGGYTVIVTNTAGSVASDAATLTVNPPATLSITAQPVSQSTTAPGGTVTFTVAATGNPAPTYQWYYDGAAISGATGSSLALTNVQASAAGNYYVVVNNGANSVTSAVASFAIDQTGNSAAHALSGPGYAGGGTVTITNTLTYAATASALSWSVLLPSGWSFASSSGTAGDVGPAAGQTDELDWAWSTIPASPVTFSYTLNVPAGQTGEQQIVALVGVRNGTSLQFLAQPDPLMVPQLLWHSADESHEGRISLLDLTRVIELYNTHNGSTRTGAYTDQAGTEDGFAPDTTRPSGQAVTLPYYHSADENHEGKISLLELTRVIELYNYHSGTTRTGQYHAQAGTEDGFAPGP
jgi:streptogramin lyase